MPFQLRFEPEHALAIVEFDGTVDGATLVGAMEALLADDRCAGCRHTLWDLDRALEMDVVPDDIGRVVAAHERIEARLGPGRASFLSTRWFLGHLMTLLKSRRRDSEREIRVFGSYRSAYTWAVGGPAPTATPDP